MLETSYPACILDSDKIRLYRQANRVTSRAKYIGEQRVIKVMRSHSVHRRVKTVKEPGAQLFFLLINLLTFY